MSSGGESEKRPRRQGPQQVFLRGLAISLPAILTIVILLWLLGGINDYIIQPTTSLVKWTIAEVVDGSVPVTDDLIKLDNGPPLKYVGSNYLVASELRSRYEAHHRSLLAKSDQLASDASLSRSLDAYFRVKDDDADWIARQALVRDVPEVFVPLDGRAVPYPDYADVAETTATGDMPTSVTGLYMDLVVRRYVGSAFLLSAFALSLIIVAVYFLGRVVSVRLGSWFVSEIENRLLARLPVIRNVYGSAKQVTEFLFSENQVEYRRVVAIEYPRRGIWSLAFVTGEGILDITAAIGEPCVSVLVPSSPMPVTGYTMCVPRSSVLDIDLTVDQAFQFCISCGVLVPSTQKVTPEILQREMSRRLAERMQADPTDRRAFMLPPRRPGTESDNEEDRS